MTKLKIFYERKKNFEFFYLILFFVVLSIGIFSTWNDLTSGKLFTFSNILIFLIPFIFLIKFLVERKNRKLGKELEETIECKRYEVLE